MKILLTGGAGFIGSNIADAYASAGHEVFVIDNLSSGKKENVPAAARFVLCDIGRTRRRKRSGPSAPRSSTITRPRSTCGLPSRTRSSTRK